MIPLRKKFSIPQRKKKFNAKPTYKIPLTVEIMSIPWNGLKVASTFSGCGGSCLGYRWAGLKVVWANEFLEAAQESYRANFLETFLDCRDIKEVTAQDILNQTGLSIGELDVFDGSPPCQAFSMAGKREKGWGIAKKYENGKEQCNEQMFFEYARLLKGLMPKVFIAENVKGLTVGSAAKMMGSHQDDMFDSQDDTILRTLMACGYVVHWRVLNAAHYGVPQNRVRVIFQGIRRDLNRLPVWPDACPWIYSVKDACPWIYSVEGGSVGAVSDKNRKLDINEPSHTVMVGTNNRAGYGTTQFQVRSYASQNHPIDKPMPSILANGGKSQLLHVKECQLTPYRLKRLQSEGDKKNAFKMKINLDKPCKSATTIPHDMAISEGSEMRKLSIMELKRIGGFPDDFILTGSYAKQWARIGNSVAPPFMRAIAAKIRDEILLKK